MNERERAKLDQEAASVGDALPAIWFSLYSGCLLKGFTPAQSMSLVRTWIRASLSRRTDPHLKPPEEDQ